MAEFNFVGPSYQASTQNADAERCINLFVETVEGSGKSPSVLLRTPGLKAFSALAGKSVPEQFFHPTTQRGFAVSGTNFTEVFQDGTNKVWGQVVIDGTRPYITGSNLQLMITSGGAAYSFTLANNTFASIAIDSTQSNTIQGPVQSCGYTDGFFVVLLRNSSKFQISALLDDTTWSALDVAQISVFPDNIVGFKINQRSLWFWGAKQSQVYYNSGNPNFPFSPIPGGFIENGLVAQDSPVKMDNALFWLGADDRGIGMAWRSQGYTPVRVSNHAVESQWQKYSTISDAVSYSYQENGHTFWVLQFPSANRTWVYDAATNSWHERQNFDGTAHLAISHMLAWSKHYVGSRLTGQIYQSSWQFLTDAGNPIVRQRVAPYIASEDHWIYFNKLEFQGNAGVAPVPPLLDGDGNPRPAQMFLDWSDDGAYTWSNQRIVSVGFLGQYPNRIIVRRMGRVWGTIGRVYRVTMSDPVDWAFTNAYVNAPPDMAPKRRLAAQIGDAA